MGERDLKQLAKRLYVKESGLREYYEKCIGCILRGETAADLKCRKIIDWERAKVEFISGATIKTVAGRIGCSVDCVWSHFRKMGVNTKWRLGNRDLSALVKVYQSGESATSCARRFSMTTSAVIRAFEKLGVKRTKLESVMMARKMHPGSSFKKIDMKTAESLFVKGFSITQISKTLGVNRQTLSGAFRRANIEVPSNGEAIRTKWDIKLRSELGRVNWAELVGNYNDGMSFDQLAQKSGLPDTRLRREFRRRGVKVRGGSENLRRLWAKRKANVDWKAISLEYSQGSSLRAVAQRHHVASNTIAARLPSLGVRLRTKQENAIRQNAARPKKTYDWEAAAKAYESGMSFGDIRRVFDIPRKLLPPAFAGMGVELRRGSSIATVMWAQKHSGVNWAAMRKEYEAGRSLSQLSVTHGLARLTIKKHLISLGAKLRTPKESYRSGAHLDYRSQRREIANGAKASVHRGGDRGLQEALSWMGSAGSSEASATPATGYELAKRCAGV